jgi:tetratricopeptide (TPR) repeat protein
VARLPPEKFERRMKKVSPYSLLLLLLAICFTLATLIVPRAENWNGGTKADNVWTLLLGEGRRLFANELFVMGDVYFHSGYYPSIFDRQETDLDVADPAHGKTEDADSTSDDFLGPPKDWIEALDRHFVPNRHTHLSSGGASGHAKASAVQEILPWMKLSAEMNPQLIDSYTVGSYWLRAVLHKPDEAREFLFQGLRANPGNPELLFDLGRLYEESYNDTNRAVNVWKAALRQWQAQSEMLKTNYQSRFQCEEITVNLARTEENQGNFDDAIHYLEIAKTVSQTPDTIQTDIDNARQKMTGAATNSPAP